MNNRFRFGCNWEAYCRHHLDETSYEAARSHIRTLTARHCPSRLSFLDIGCGSGLFSTAASDEGFVRVVGFDFDPDCIEVGKQVVSRFAGKVDNVNLVWGDVLDKKFVESLGKFSFVYAWGSLHHTGMMWEGIANAAGPVLDNGIFVLAIYNRSFLSPMWKFVKRLYGHSGRVTRSLLVGLCYIVGALAKAVYTCENPLRKGRGMSFYYDIVDWVGGYPYEYASVNEVTSFVEKLGFQLMEVTRGGTPIACNEFVFRKCEAGEKCG